MQSTTIMKHLTGLILLVTTLGCGHGAPSSPPQEDLSIREISVDGLTRTYALYLPPGGQDRSIPLVMVLHGGGGKITNMIGWSNRRSPYRLWMEVAEKEGLIIVYPQAVNGPTGRPNWHDCRLDAAVLPEVDDVHFLTTLLDTLAARYPVDTDRIYVTGMSNGGIMTLRLAVEVPQRLAAVAPLCASFPDTSECGLPSTPLPIFLLNGTADPLLPYKGGTIGNPPRAERGTVIPVEQTVALWQHVNGTDTVARVRQLPDLDPHDGSTITLLTYPDPLGNNEVVFCRINGGGHAAPSIREQYSPLWTNYVGPQNHDAEMVELVWDFFRDKVRHPR